VGNESAIRAGRAFVELFADDSKLMATLRGASSKLKGWGKSLTAMGGAMVAPILHAAYASIERGSKFFDISKRTGASTEALSKYAYAAEQTGASISDLEGGIRRMQKSIAGQADATEGTTGSLHDIGIEAEALRGLKVEEQFEAIRDRIVAIEDPTERAAAQMSIFGRSGSQLLPMMEELDQLSAEAEKLGFVMAGVDAAEADAAGDNLAILGNSMKTFWAAIGTAVTPIVSETVVWFAEVVRGARDWITEHQSLVALALKVGAAFVVIGSGAMFVGNAMTALAGAMTLVSAHPLILALGVLAVGAGALYLAYDNLARAELASARASSARAARGDERRARDIEQMKRLEELAGKERLNSEEMKEAATIIAALQGYYGDLGLTLDETTGKVHGLANGWRNFRDQAAKFKIYELKTQLIGLADELEIAGQRARGERGLSLFDMEGSMKAGQNEAKRLINQREAIKGMLQSLEGGLRTDEALAGKPTADGKKSAGPSRGQLKEDAEMQHRTNDLLLQQIDDRYVRELALIRERYRYEIEQAEAAHKSRKYLKDLEYAEELEIANAQAAREKELREESDRQSEELARNEEDYLEDHERKRKDLAEETERLQIEATKKGMDKELALLELRQRKERAEAVAAGLDMGAVAKKQDLERQVAVAGATRPAQQSVAGTFSAFGAAGLGTGSGSAERTAKATERTVEELVLIRKGKGFVGTGPQTSGTLR
jgi:hypothetical protein